MNNGSLVSSDRGKILYLYLCLLFRSGAASACFLNLGLLIKVPSTNLRLSYALG